MNVKLKPSVFVFALATAFVGVVLFVVLVLLPGTGPAPMDLARVTRAADSRFGVSYAWSCQVAYPPQRIVVCESQPNGFYRADYQVKDDGTPVLVASVPPPKE